MEYRRLGRTGVLVAPMVLGTDNIANPTTPDESIRMIHAAIDGGINMIDTSNSYAAGESERIIGEALAMNGRRDDVIIATKFHYPVGPGPNDRGNSRLHIIRACEGSLKRLGVDHIDLYQTHRPDLEIPVEETLGALDHLVQSGKVRYVGSTTAPSWHVVEALMTSEMRGWAKFVSEQSPYNLLDRRLENEMLQATQHHGLAVFAWSPMAMGVLAGRYPDPGPDDEQTAPEGSRVANRGGIYAERVTPAGVRIGNRFARMARDNGFEPAQLAICWVKDQPGITAPIIGPKSVAQLENLLPVLEMTLPDDVRAFCDDLVTPGSVVASFFNSAPWMRWKHL
ncbi:MAG: aldo/keto reductase [Ilumatobacteraceae bacterium]|nr:aldo/keto reductase [Ilumatobacteraceae bacterium]